VEITSGRAFAAYWDGFRARTTRVIAHIPADRLERTPPGGTWTFGDLIRHLAGIERDMYGENVQGLPSRYPGHDRSLADGYDAVVAYMDRKHREAMEIFAALTPSRLQAKCMTPAGADITVWKWLRSMPEHEAHHRGQIHYMLSLMGIGAPPLYGLTEEEVHARSLHHDVRLPPGGAHA
jgi:uncharacterized damage-inducible protein DinB